MLVILFLLSSAALQEPVIPAKPELHLANDGKPVRSLAFYRDGSGLLSVGGNPRVWDLSTRKERFRLDGAWGDPVWSGALSRDGSLIAAFEYTHEVVELWDGRSGRETASIFLGGRVCSMALAPDESFVITFALGIARHDLLDFAKPPLQYRGHPDEVSQVALSPDGKTLAASCSDRTVHLWESGTGRPLRVLRTEGFEGSLLAFTPNGEMLVVGGEEEKIVELWDVSRGEARGRLEGFKAPLSALTLSLDGRFLASLEENCRVQLLELASLKPVLSVGGKGEKATCLAMAPDRTRMAVGTNSGDIFVWSMIPEGAAVALDLEEAWTRLAELDAAKAYLTAARVRGTGAKSAAFLKRRLLAAAEAKTLGGGPHRTRERGSLAAPECSHQARRNASRSGRVDGLDEVLVRRGPPLAPGLSPEPGKDPSAFSGGPPPRSGGRDSGGPGEHGGTRGDLPGRREGPSDHRSQSRLRPSEAPKVIPTPQFMSRWSSPAPGEGLAFRTSDLDRRIER
jgi:hypothetical protein